MAVNPPIPRLVLTSLILLSLCPLALASPTDDTLSRMFPYVSGARAKVAASGIGWYDTAIPSNDCLAARVLGVQLPAGGVFYYETARIYTNLPGFVKPFPMTGRDPVPLACPPALNPACTAATGCAIHVDSVKFGPSATTIAPQDGLVCAQRTFVTCIPLGATWWLGACEWVDATFTGRPAGNNKGVFAGTGLENVKFSRDIDCKRNYLPFRDFSFLLGANGNGLSTGAEGVPVAAVVPFGGIKDESAFLVSCLTVTVQVVDPPNPVVTDVIDGVDWALVLDLDAPPASWLGPLLAHQGVGADGQILAGFYDLGGDNDCDVDADGVEDPPSCFDGLDNDNDGEADDADDECYDSTDSGAEYYDADSNSE